MPGSRFPIILIAVATLVLVSCGKSGSQPGATDSTRTADSSRAADAKLERTQEQIRLAMRFKVGDSFGYAVTTVQDVTMTRDSAVEKSKQRLSYRYRFDVLEAMDNGSARLRVTCLGVQFKGDYNMNGEAKSMTYDSGEKNDPAKDKTFAQYNAPVNAPFEIILSKECRVEKVSAYDDVIRRLLGKDFNTIKQEARRKIAEDFAEHGLKDIVQSAFQKLDDRAVGVDSSWHHLWAGDLGFLKISNDATYTLKGFERSDRGRIAHIGAVMTSRYTGSKTLDTGQGIATVEQFDVKGSGVTLFNVDLGRPDKRSLTQTIRVRFFVDPPAELKAAAPDQAKAFRLSQNATVTSSVERIAL